MTTKDNINANVAKFRTDFDGITKQLKAKAGSRGEITSEVVGKLGYKSDINQIVVNFYQSWQSLLSKS